ncbi:Rossmann-fold NAD(P)-binding domain-containing protein [Roseomonas gilardii]|uniref:hypothetical protein n=1 Tax=Roseomonas gilardii TaxID=257708 RepID=UPI0004877E9B|nr:hypothetical protein [Roseomonas gilardii]SUE62716.1 Uncharacterised protein [Roseomonas gilardii subsp. rosea]
MNLVHNSEPVRGAAWAARFATMLPDLPFHIWPDTGDPAAVRSLATRFPALEVLFSVGARVDQFDLRTLPPGLPMPGEVERGRGY